MRRSMTQLVTYLQVLSFPFAIANSTVEKNIYPNVRVFIQKYIFCGNIPYLISSHFHICFNWCKYNFTQVDEQWDLILSVPQSNSLISVTLRTCTYNNVISQTIIYPNANPNQKKLKCRPRIPSPNNRALSRPKRRRVTALVLGL